MAQGKRSGRGYAEGKCRDWMGKKAKRLDEGGTQAFGNIFINTFHHIVKIF